MCELQFERVHQILGVMPNCRHGWGSEGTAETGRKRIVSASGPEQCPHATLPVQYDDVAIVKVVGLTDGMDERNTRTLRHDLVMVRRRQEAAVAQQGRRRKATKISEENGVSAISASGGGDSAHDRFADVDRLPSGA
jgi:hypothetical protein